MEIFPFYRAKNSKDSFISKTKVKYLKFEVKDIKVEGNVANVGVKIVSSVPGIMGKHGQILSQPPSSSEFQEKWLYIYDNWYKEYRMGMVEQSVVYY
jgi:hypothetical protein